MYAYWIRFSALIPAAALVFLDQTILPVALPSIQQEMHATDTELQWCVNSYLLAIAIFVLLSGKWGDKLGHKTALMLGMLGFILFSVLCGVSPNVDVLILARALQGFSAALMFPAQTAMITHIVPLAKRGRAIGTIVSISSLFLILGPFIGGYLVKISTWRWIFGINLPIGIIGFWMIYAFLPQVEKGRGKIDWIGFAFFAVGVSALTFVCMQAVDWGWASSPIIFFAVVAIIALAFLLRRETKSKHPFLDLSLFKHPVYLASNISITAIQFFLMISVFRTIYMQDVLGFTPFVTGIIMCISGMPLLFMAPIAGLLSDRLSPKIPIALGYLLLIFSCFWLAFFSKPSLIILTLALIVFGMGIPLVFTPSISSALASVPKTKVGAASGMLTTLRMIGGTLGLALIHLFVSTVEQYHTPIEGKLVAKTISFSYVHFALAFLLIIVFTIAWVFHSRKSTHHLPEGPAEGWD